MSELIDFLIVSVALVAVGIYGLVVKRNAIRMLFSIAIAAAEVAVGLGLIIVAYRLYKEIDVAEFRSMRG